MTLTLQDASSRPDLMVILESRLPTSCFLVKVRLGPSSSLFLLRQDLQVVVQQVILPFLDF